MLWLWRSDSHSQGALQHSPHNLCCDWQGSINLGSLCSIIISAQTQLDSTQQASWHCGGSQRKVKVSRQGGWLPHQWIFYGGACQCHAECTVTDKHMWPQIGLCAERTWLRKQSDQYWDLTFQPAAHVARLPPPPPNKCGFHINLAAIKTQWESANDGFCPL